MPSPQRSGAPLRGIPTFIFFNKEEGENPFKISAYRKASKILEDYPIDVKEAYQAGGIPALTAIPGIGAALSQKIAEFLETGRMHKYEEIMSQKPQRE